MKRDAAAAGLEQAARLLEDMARALRATAGPACHEAVLEEISAIYGDEAELSMISFLNAILNDAELTHTDFRSTP